MSERCQRCNQAHLRPGYCPASLTASGVTHKSPVVTHSVTHDKPAVAHAERQARYRARHADDYRLRHREYMRRWRSAARASA
jgi:hypothetical protein